MEPLGRGGPRSPWRTLKRPDAWRRPMPERHGRAVLALVLVQFAFASLAVVGKDALARGLPPLALASIRVLLASLLLAGVALLRFRLHVPWPDLLRLAVLSILGVVLNQLLFIEGLARTTAVNATVLIATIPVFTLLVAIVLGRERFHARRAAGVAVALLGTLVMLRAERFDPSDRVVLGNVLVVLNCLSYSFYLVLSRPLLQRLPSPVVVAWTFLLGALVLVPIGLGDAAGAVRAHDLTPRVLLDLAWIVVVASVLAYLLNNYALKRLRASTVASFVFLQPAFGVALALLLLPDEHLDARTLVAALVILAGVALVVRTEGIAVPPKPA